MKFKTQGVISPVSRGEGGVHVAYHKNTQDSDTVRIPEPAKVVLPMQQHIGAPCTPLVSVGDTVEVGQVIGDTDKFVSAPIHATISGKVSAISPVVLASGRTVPAVTIESDGEMRPWSGIEPPKVTSKEDFLAAVRASGLVGLGGAGFPSHVKLTVPPDKKVDTLVVNAAECEPFITVDYRECMDNSEAIFSGIAQIRKYLGVDDIIIGIEDNKPQALELLGKLASKDGGNIKIMALKSKYPQGAEKMMVNSATGRHVPLGKLPADVGCIVMNVASVAFVGRYLATGKPLVSRSMTVDGSAIADPKNVRVPIGININEVVSFCGGFKAPPFKIIAGGPMMGSALVNTDAPVIKSYNALLAFLEGTFKVKPERDCIRCGRCSQACPMGLMPTEVMRYTKADDVSKLRECYVEACMQCGSCAYACPAGKPLVQYMVLAKDILREAGAKK